MRLVGDRLERLTPGRDARSRARSLCWAPTPTKRGRARSPGSSRQTAIAAEEELRVERVLDADAYGFTHPLVAAAAREAIGPLDAAALHARAAALLADDGAGRPARRRAPDARTAAR